jgi:hypothetical protein
LKGSSLTIGARGLGALCAQMEVFADRDQADSVTPQLLTAFDQEFLKVKDALARELASAPAK